MIINGADLPWCYMSGMKTGVGLLAKPERGHQQILFSKSHVQAGQNRQSEQSRALGRPAGWGLRAKPTPGTLLVGVGLWAMAGKAYHSLRLCPVPTGRGNMGPAESKGQGSLVNGYKSGMCFPIHLQETATSLAEGAWAQSLPSHWMTTQLRRHMAHSQKARVKNKNENKTKEETEQHPSKAAHTVGETIPQMKFRWVNKHTTTTTKTTHQGKKSEVANTGFCWT